MKFYILAPAEIVSGGPELAHQMCAELNKNGQEAFMYYIFSDVEGPADANCVDKFKKYNTTHVTSHEDVDTNDSIVVVPEGLADRAKWFKNATIVLWWMSVDNYFRDCKDTDVNTLDGIVTLHLTQSEYARDFLSKQNIASDKIMTVSDYISDMYGQFILPAEYRKNIALYNPKKGYEELRPVIDATPFVEWRPLIGLTEEEMIVLMQIAKVYVDFGNHPGKDRIPREAALCGCCVVTNRRGSANFYEDVAISDTYKIDTEDNSYIEKATALIEEICNNYANLLPDFIHYQNKIKVEKDLFSQDVVSFINHFTNTRS